MKVIHVPRRFVESNWGGTETAVINTARTMTVLGHEAHVFTPSIMSHVPREVVSGIPVRRFPYLYPYVGLSNDARESMDLCGGNLFSASLLAALMKEPGLDLIHAHTMKRVGGICRTVANRRGIPYVVTVHGGLLDTPVGEEQRRMEPTRGAFEWGKALGWMVGSRRVLVDADAIVCVGLEESRRMQQRLPDTRVEYVPNGVDVEGFRTGDGAGFRSRFGIDADRHVVLTVGRIDPQKNQRLLVDALPQMLRAVPNLHLLLVGHVTDPSYERELRARADQLGVESHLTLIPGLSRSEGLVDAYHAADQFALPSVHEPFGIAVLEAWAASLPVVASARGGLVGLIDDGRTGILADPDRPRSFVSALTDLAVNSARCGALGLAGSCEALNRYSWSEVTGRLLRLYEEVAGRHERLKRRGRIA